MNIVSNCPLCEERGLHVLEGSDVHQCLSCGYVTSDNYKGKKEDSEMYQKLTPEMQSWSKEANGRIWIPSMITLPFGTLYPENIDGKMKWAFAEMVDIPEEEKEGYPDGTGGYFNKMYDTENAKVYDEFLYAMHELNQRAKDSQTIAEVKDIQLPKLKKIDG